MTWQAMPAGRPRSPSALSTTSPPWRARSQPPSPASAPSARKRPPAPWTSTPRPAINPGTATVQGTLTLNTDTVVRGLAVSSGTATGINDPAAAITGVALDQVSVASTTGTAVLLSDTTGALTFTSISANGAA